MRVLGLLLLGWAGAAMADAPKATSVNRHAEHKEADTSGLTTAPTEGKQRDQQQSTDAQAVATEAAAEDAVSAPLGGSFAELAETPDREVALPPPKGSSRSDGPGDKGWLGGATPREEGTQELSNLWNSGAGGKGLNQGLKVSPATAAAVKAAAAAAKRAPRFNSLRATVGAAAQLGIVAADSASIRGPGDDEARPAPAASAPATKKSPSPTSTKPNKMVTLGNNIKKFGTDTFAKIKTFADSQGPKCDPATIKAGWTEEVEKKVLQANLDQAKEETKQPSLYITYGPPASGKGGVMDNTFEFELTEGIISTGTAVQVVVDDVVKAVPGFKEAAAQCKNLKERQALYMGLRKGKGMRPWVSEKATLDDFCDEMMVAAFKANKNVQWETTGASVSWTISVTLKQARDAGFRVVVVYPYVKVKTLLERAHARQKETGQIAAPDDDIRATASLAALDVEPLFNYFLWDPSKNCMEGKDVIKSPRKCDDAIKTSRLYLWDNNGEKNKETIIAALEASYPSPHIVAVSPHCGPASAKGQWDPDDTAGAVLKVFVETRVGRATCAGMWGGRTAKILDDKGLLARLLKHRTSDLKRAAAVKGGLTASYT